MRYRLSGIVGDSIVDGQGLRLAVFMQGCPHACPGCHNPETWDPNGGREADTAEVQQLIDRNPIWDGLTLSGGEPFIQPEAAAEMAAYARARGLNVWAYTGYTWEELAAMADPAVQQLLGLVDVLVDGRYEQDRRSLELPFRGSANQRLIDVLKSREQGCAVLWEPPAW